MGGEGERVRRLELKDLSTALDQEKKRGDARTVSVDIGVRP